WLAFPWRPVPTLPSRELPALSQPFLLPLVPSLLVLSLPAPWPLSLWPPFRVPLSLWLPFPWRPFPSLPSRELPALSRPFLLPLVPWLLVRARSEEHTSELQ